MKKETKINLLFKKDGRLNQARLTISKDMIELMELTDDSEVYFELKENRLVVKKYSDDTKEQEPRKIILDKGGKDGAYTTYKLSIPLKFLKDLEIEKNDNEIEVEILNKILIINKKRGDMKRKGEMITVKVNKGGVGKTTLSSWIAHGLALLGYKTCILTSDSQNNILDIMFKEGSKPQFEEGLRSWVLHGEGDKIKLRENLYFIPLESSVFGNSFLKKLPDYLEGLKTEFDFIINDSIPTMKIDKEFVQASEKIIIPAFCDRSTVEGIINVIQDEGIDKIFAIIVNKYENVETQNKYYKQLSEVLKDTEILFPEPIKNRALVAKIIDRGHTVWETKAKQMEEIQNTLLIILSKLIGGQNSESSR